MWFLRKLIVVVFWCSFGVRANIELCGSQHELELVENGEKSSQVISLTPKNPSRNNCKMRISAPKTHVVNLQFVRDQNSSNSSVSEEEIPSCIMSIYLADDPSTTFWKGDLCSYETHLPELDLLTPDFRIIWASSKSPVNFKIVVTAVGRGVQTCQKPGQHICMRIGRNPMLCISDHLICDGIENCPKSSAKSDENENICKEYFLKRELLKLIEKHRNSLQGKSNTEDALFKMLLPAATKKPPELVTESAKPHLVSKQDSVSQMLSKYGPWGYLMLGLFICGVVLIFCGMWEYCFRKPKETVNVESSDDQTQPTRVLVFGPQDEAAGTGTLPPNYDELDQPPSYITLFPNSKPGSSESSNMVNNVTEVQISLTTN